jgi:hypothetical protein
VEVGRVDFYNMPSFKKNETALLRAYLKRATAWKNGQTIVPNNALIRDSWGYFSGEAFSASGYRAYSSLVRANNTVLASYASFWPWIGNQTWLFAWGGGGGSFTSAGGVGSTTSFAQNPTNAVFIQMFGSFFGDWCSPHISHSSSVLAVRQSANDCILCHLLNIGIIKMHLCARR